MCSITRTSTGPLADPNFSPSCSRKAVKMERPAGLAGGGAAFGSSADGALVRLVGTPVVHDRCRSNFPVNSVLSTTALCSSKRERLVANSAMVTPTPSSVRFNPSIPDLGKPQNVGWVAPGADASGGGESTE